MSMTENESHHHHRHHHHHHHHHHHDHHHLDAESKQEQNSPSSVTVERQEQDEHEGLKDEITVLVDKLVSKADGLISGQSHADITGPQPVAKPSRAAPPYLQDLVDNPLLNEEDSSTSSYSSPFFDSSNSRSFSELQDFRTGIRDDDRLSKMYTLRYNLSSRFDNRAWVHPHGTTNFDYNAIPRSRKREQLDRYKNQTRRDNWKYLSNHPEIQAVITIFVKKLLVAQPEDAAEYLAEFFATRLKGEKDNTDFEMQVASEVERLSAYHRQKLKAQGKINIKPITIVHSEMSGEEWAPESDANWLKRMGIGPLAADFDFDDPSGLMQAKHKQREELTPKMTKKKKKKRVYCGCKDWKLKKNQTSRRSTAGSMGNVDTLKTDEEGDSEEEEEESEWTGNLDDEEEDDEGLTWDPENADRAASALVQELFVDPEAVYKGHRKSLGHTYKNI